MDQFFSETATLADAIEGMLSPFSMAVVDSLLTFQVDSGIAGDLVEIGTFRGKSAVVLGRRMQQKETLHLFDIVDYLNVDGLKRAGVAFNFTLVDTKNLTRWKLRRLKKSVRFCHIDASHGFEATVHEMSLADHMMTKDGIICMDDFTNLNFSQILAATYNYLFTKKTDLTVFLVTSEKAYLCKTDAFPAYAKFVVDEMIPSMKERDIQDPCIARTDISKTYRAFHLRKKTAGEVDECYGKQIYGHLLRA